MKRFKKFEIERHWMLYLKPLVIWGFPFLKDEAGKWFILSDDLTLQTFTSIMIAIYIIWTIHNIFDAFLTNIEVDEETLTVTKGLIIRKTKTFKRSNIESIEIKRSLLGICLDYGKLIIKGDGMNTAKIDYIESINSLNETVFKEYLAD